MGGQQDQILPKTGKGKSNGNKERRPIVKYFMQKAVLFIL